MNQSSQTTGVILGVDYGAKRVGIARGVTDGKLATPLLTLPNKHSLLKDLKELAQTEQAIAVVVGLPRGLDGQETAQTAVVRRFADELSDTLSIPVHLQDEAMTSEIAESRLGQRAAKGDIDKEAAAILLQDYLELL